MKNLKDLKVGDKVYDVIVGYGIVKAISEDKEDEYPIEVCFDNEDTDTYGFDGRRYTSDNNPSLFLTNPFEQQGKDMLVRSNNSDWNVRDVIVASNGIYVKSEWLEAKEIPEPTELILSMQEIADKFGVDVETLKIKK